MGRATPLPTPGLGSYALTAAGFQPVNERFPAEYARLLAEYQLLRCDYAPAA